MKIYYINYDSEGMDVGEEASKQHLLGRQLLAFALLREDVTIGHSLDNKLAYGSSGKPYLRDLPDIHFNISHTKGLVACAIGQAPVGIDVERIKPYPKSVLRKMTEKERFYIQNAKDPDEAFVRVWTMKETMVKWTGEGLAAFSQTECVPDDFKENQAFRQILWQGQYVITALEDKNWDCISEKKV